MGSLRPRRGSHPVVPAHRLALAPYLMSRPRFRHDDLGGRIVGDPLGAADDEVGAFPGPPGGVELAVSKAASLRIVDGVRTPAAETCLQ
jgi:hypothetical protein